MKKTLYGIVSLLLTFSAYAMLQGTALAQETKGQKLDLWTISKTENTMKYVPGEVIVKFKPAKINLKTSGWQRSVQSFATSQDMQQTDSIASNNIVVLTIEGTETVEQKIIELEANANVEYAEPNYIRHIQSFNDTHADLLRWLAQISGYQAFGIFAWNGDQSVTWTVVAIIDMGVAYDHPDLINQMWDGTHCKDGYWTTIVGGCIHGYNFVEESNDPYPDGDHGTHIAGTIAAEANNNKGIIWVNYNAKIMAIRAGAGNSLDVIDIIEAINFATQNWAKVINASYGGDEFTQAEYDAMSGFKVAWWIFVAAAGNDSANNDSAPSYPCNYNLDNIICVAATDQDDDLASFSNYGQSNVDVWAPWVDIYSSLAGVIIPMNESFESIDPWDIPAWWEQWGTWANWWVYDFWVAGWKSLAGDITIPYSNNVNSFIKKSVDTSSFDSGFTVGFYAKCDTEYYTGGWNDYMTLEVSSDWITFNELAKWDEASLDDDGIEWNNIGWWSPRYYFSYDMTWAYINSNFSLRFRRVTNWSINSSGWCVVDDVSVGKYRAGTSTEPYGYMAWTSMATPHVVGLVSLARSMRPELGYQAIKSVILGSGDSLSSLSGKTVSGKRINAYNTLMALWGANAILIQTYAAVEEILSGQWIQNNLNAVNWEDITNFSWLYFAQMSWSTELWRITFGTWFDLTDTWTQDFLQHELSGSIGMEQGKIRFVPWTGFAWRSATLQMNLPISLSGLLWSINSWSFAVREWSGWAVTGNDMITSLTTWICTGSYCPIYLNVAHFTQFDLKPFLTNVHIQSNNANTAYAKSGDIISLSFTGSEVLSGVTVTINGIPKTAVWWWISRYATGLVTGQNTTGTFTINYFDIYNNSWATLTGTTDASSVMMDSTTPGVATWVTPTANQIIGYQPLQFAWTSSNESSVTYSYEIILSGSVTVVASWSTTATGFTFGGSLVNGIYHRTVWPVDRAGNIGLHASTGTFRLNVPGTFSFVAQTNKERSTSYQSNQITLNSLITWTQITVVWAMYNINEGSFTWATWTVVSGNRIQLVMTSSADYSTTTPALLTIWWRTGTFEVTTKDSPWGNPWWPPTPSVTCTLSNLICEDNEYVRKSWVSCIGGKLGDSCGTTGTNIPTYLMDTHQGNTVGSPFSPELNTAYLYAFTIGITTIPTITKANMTGTLLRKHLAKMISAFSIKVLEKTPNTWLVCTFDDMGNEMPEMKLYAKAACQLGLMWRNTDGTQNDNFFPNKEVTRAQFGTVLSRALRWEEYNGGEPYYKKHLDQLKKIEIMKNITDPIVLELRWYVMLMMMRSSELE